ncbi:MAG: PEP-CTERM sorting domain-containing protein [Planctomycetota bacterium]
MPSTAALSYTDAIGRPTSNTLIPNASVDLTADTIEILFDPTDQTISELQSFRGFRFADNQDTLASITGVTIDPATTLDLQPDDIRFFANNLTVNVAGLTLTSASPNRILLNVTFDEGALAAITGDYNGNGQVEQGDLNIVLNNWGSPLLPADGIAVDALPNGASFDGLIDQNELNAVLNNWGSTATPDLPGFATTSLPEPATAALLGLGGLATLRRR